MSKRTLLGMPLMSVLLLAFVVPVNGQTNVIPSARHIVIKGHAEQDVLPDRFTIRMTVEAIDVQPEQARNRVQAHIASLLGAMKESGVLQEQVTATAISVKPKIDYQERKEVFEGTEVSRNLRATFASPDDLQTFLAKVETSQEVQIDGIETFYSEHEKVEMQLREKAIAISRQKASELAKAYGARIAGLYAVSEVEPRFDYGVDAYQSFDIGGASSLDLISPDPQP